MSTTLRSMLAVTTAALLLPMPAFAQDVVMRRPVPVTRAATAAAWSTTPWVIYDGANPIDPSRACGDYTERRQVSCKSPGGDVVDEYFCAGSPKPASSQAARHDEGCTYSWNTGDWADPGDACTLTEQQGRKVSCLRDTDKVVMPDSMCQGARPDDKRTVQDFSTCTYAWDAGSWRDPGASCTNTERQTRDVSCLRDLDKASVDASNCKPGDRPSATQDVRDVSGCTYSWKTDPFVDPGSSCTRSETQTRTVTCRRSLNEELADDSSCTATKPGSTQVVEDYSSCGFTAVQPTDWTPSSTCSSTATKTRTFKCQRSNDGGEIVADSLCTQAGVSLTETVSEPNYSTCSHSWSESGFVDPGNNCGNETWTQTVTCKRDLDKQVVSDGSCTTARPDSTSVRYDISSCSYSAVNPGAWTWNSTCSASAVRSRTYDCRRSDGTIVPAAECQSRGVGVVDTVQEANYAGCTNSWAYSGYVDPGASCTAHEMRSRTSWCKRDLDGSVQPDASCSGQAQQALTMDAGADYSGCSYAAVNPGAWTWNSTCSASATRSRTYDCRRSDGTVVAAAECQSRGIGVVDTVQEANYSGCTNSWAYSGYVDPGASCTAAETHTRTSWCKRDLDGSVQPDGACSGQAQQSLTMNAGADYSGCGYSAVNWTGYTPNSTCSASATKTRTAQCRRGDGTIVAGSECTSRGVAVSETVSEPNYSTCSSSWRGSGYADPGASCGSETWTQTVTCRRDLDNQLMPDSSCTGAPPSTTEVRTDYSACTFSPHDHGYGACDGTNRPHYWDCMRSDGTDGFPASQCGKSNPEYENCYSYQPSATQSSCTNGSQTVTNSCRRSDGQYVATSFCGQPASYTQSCTSYTWAQGEYGAFGACQSDNRQYQYRDVYCQANNGGNLSRVDDSLCGGGKPTNVNTQACSYYTYAWTYAGATEWNSTCSSNAQRTQQYYCRREQDGASVGGENCPGGNPSYVETQPVYSSCTYTTNWTGYGACPAGAGQTQSRSVASCTRNQTGENVDLGYCGGQRSESQACVVNPGGQPTNTTLGTYAFATCSQQYDYGTQGTMPGVDPSSCRTAVATYAQQCTNGGNFATNSSCNPKPWVSNPRGPTGYPCDIVCR